jgi:hypothetical protein
MLTEIDVTTAPDIATATGLVGRPLERTPRRGPIRRTLGHVRLIAGPTQRAAAILRDGADGDVLVKLVAAAGGIDTFGCGFRIRSGLWLELDGEGAEVLAYYVG